MNTAILKINSYQNSNTILIDDKIIFERNTLENYKKDSPILSKASDILYDIYREINANFALTIQGNPFEQAFFSLCCAEFGRCAHVEGKPSTLTLSTAQRLKMLEALGAKIDHSISLSLDSDISASVSLPSYAGITFTEGSSWERILVSDNMEYLRSEVMYSGEMAFCINGQSEKVDDKYIIGCTSDNVQELVTTYIETKYINPLIGEIYSRSESLYPTSDRSHFLITRVEPYYFIEENDMEISLFKGEYTKINVQSISADSNGNIVSNAPEDFCRVLGMISTQNNEEQQTVSFSEKDLFTVKGISCGSAEICFYYDDPNPFARVNICVQKHTYAKEFVIEIADSNQLLVGYKYPLRITSVPENAEDLGTAQISIDNTDVAELAGNIVIIKKLGTFAVTVRGQIAQKTCFFSVCKPVEKIIVSGLPRNGKLRSGKEITVKCEVIPRDATNQRVDYSLMTGENTDISVNHVDNSDNTFRVFGTSGYAILKFFSPSSPNVFCDNKLIVRDTTIKPWFFVKAGFYLLLAAIVLLLFRANIVWFALALFLGAFVIGCVHRECFGKILLVFAIAAAVAIGYLRLNVFYSKELLLTMEKMPEEFFEQLSDLSYESVSNESFSYSDTLLSFDKSYYYPTSVEYIGYYFGYEDNLFFDNNHLHFIYKVTGSNPENLLSKTFFVRNSYNSVKLTGIETMEYKKGALEGFLDYSSLYQDTQYIDEAAIPDEWVYYELELDQYVNSASQISSDYINDIADTLIAQMATKQESSDDSVSYSDIFLYDTVLIVGKTPYSNVHAYLQNKLYIYLAQNEYKDGKLFRTYYYSYCFNNIKVDENGGAVIEITSKTEHTVVLDIDEEIANIKEKLASTYVMVNID